MMATRPRPERLRPGRWRLGSAVAASLLLHGAALWWLVAPERAGRPPVPQPRQSMQVLWITAPAPASPVEAPVARAEAPGAKPFAGPVREVRSAPSPAVLALPEGTGPGMVALPAPLPAASDAREAPAVRWSPEDVARAARLELEWQRRHGTPAAAALAAGPSPRALGTMSEQEWQNHATGRVTRVESEAGVYCVRLPSANRLPEVGAAPRIAAVTNC